ncbi:uncharacterized protein [Anabrus simplex]|uniref:uncharacterized protein n=1 Tax=Anabrus simplex TaxID=316456 RepID=UPI0035A26DFD
MILAIEAIYRKVYCRVRLEGNRLSELIECKVGLKQGCKLSPILFLLFINDILQGHGRDSWAVPAVNGLEIPGLIFADDVILLALTGGGLQKSLNMVEDFARKWSLKINGSKSKVLVVSKTKRRKNERIWAVQGEKVEEVSKLEYLGVILNRKGDWNDQVRAAKWKGTAALSVVNILESKFPGVNYSLQRMVLKTLVLGRALYGVELWGLEDKKDMLKQIISRFSKIIMQLPQCTANAGALLMCGECIEADCVKRVLKYWMRLKLGEGGAVLQAAYIQQLKHMYKGCWLTRVKEYLNRIGMGYIWKTVWHGKESGRLSEIVERVKDIQRQRLIEEGMEKCSLSLYYEIAKITRISITKVNRAERRGMVWWLLGLHKNRGWIRRADKSRCILCEKVANDLHLVKECVALDKVRNKLLNQEEQTIIKQGDDHKIISWVVKEWLRAGNLNKFLCAAKKLCVSKIEGGSGQCCS